MTGPLRCETCHNRPTVLFLCGGRGCSKYTKCEECVKCDHGAELRVLVPCTQCGRKPSEYYRCDGCEEIRMCDRCLETADVSDSEHMDLCRSCYDFVVENS